MKLIAFIFFTLCILSGAAYSQENNSEKDAKELQTLLEQASPDHHSSVHLVAPKRVLQIDEYLVPLAATTLVRWEKDGGKYHVKFFLQNGTVVTKTSDPSFRRAYWAVELRDKKACEQFVSLFNKLKAGDKG